MSKQLTIDIDFEKQPLEVFSEKAYLDYAMAVILDRALPHIADGLKPVQRRLVYAMSELGLKASAKYKKSARTIGDVLGKFHPHGDAACYEAMVLMAQSFSFRYPFVDGQGNWGTVDNPKSFAAMRYTEARLSPYAQMLLSELQQGTVDWVPNFDGSLEEPVVLPARLPNVLLNGASGIAVGMATDIPSHNINEVLDACCYLLDHPKATLSDIMAFIKGPDYPTAAEIITPKADIAVLYETGYGSIRMRAVYDQEEGAVVISALPYQVSGSRVLEQMAAQMLAKKLPDVSQLRDESDHENPVRLVVIPRSNRVDVDELMRHLFATTNLEASYRVNLNVIGLDHRPQVKGLLGLLTQWLEFRLDTVQRRLQYRLNQVLDRLFILEGLLIAYLNLDAVIQIIREEDHPKAVLIKRFKLVERQAVAILEIKLRQLGKLEEEKICAEQDDLNKERHYIEPILGSKVRLKKLVKNELALDKKTYGDKRRSPIVKRAEAKLMPEATRLPVELMTIVLSQQGWIRAAKGQVDGHTLNYRSGDAFLIQVSAKSNESVLCFDSSGCSYALLVHTLPSARGLGEPLTSRLKLVAGHYFTGVMLFEKSKYCVMASSVGYGFVTSLLGLYTKNRNGKTVMKVSEGGKALQPQLISELSVEFLAVLTVTGHLLLFSLLELPELTKGKGNKLIQLSSGKSEADAVSCIRIVSRKGVIVIHAQAQHLKLKPKDWKRFVGKRGQAGQLLPKGYRQAKKMFVMNDQ